LCREDFVFFFAQAKKGKRSYEERMMISALLAWLISQTEKYCSLIFFVKEKYLPWLISSSEQAVRCW
jgi:hypothetical protein